MDHVKPYCTLLTDCCITAYLAYKPGKGNAQYSEMDFFSLKSSFSNPVRRRLKLPLIQALNCRFWASLFFQGKFVHQWFQEHRKTWTDFGIDGSESTDRAPDPRLFQWSEGMSLRLSPHGKPENTYTWDSVETYGVSAERGGLRKQALKLWPCERTNRSETERRLKLGVHNGPETHA